MNKTVKAPIHLILCIIYQLKEFRFADNSNDFIYRYYQIEKKEIPMCARRTRI